VTLGEIIATLRARACIKQKTLAAYAGLTVGELKSVESGTVLPDDASLSNIARLLGRAHKIKYEDMYRALLNKGRCGPDGSLTAFVSDTNVPDKVDMVNAPPHYRAGNIECIDAIGAALACQSDPEQAFLTGQVIKYLWRWPLKNGAEDLKKARWYLERLIGKVDAK